MRDWLIEVARAAVDQKPGLDAPANDLQVYLILIQGLWAIILLLIGVLIRQLNATLNRIGEKYDDLYRLLLTEYATRADVIERVHGLRDSLGIHSTWIHIIAAATKVNLPISTGKDPTP